MGVVVNLTPVLFQAYSWNGVFSSYLITCDDLNFCWATEKSLKKSIGFPS